jgi:hypothetical protein
MLFYGYILVLFKTFLSQANTLRHTTLNEFRLLSDSCLKMNLCIRIVQVTYVEFPETSEGSSDTC